MLVGHHEALPSLVGVLLVSSLVSLSLDLEISLSANFDDPLALEVTVGKLEYLQVFLLPLTASHPWCAREIRGKLESLYLVKALFLDAG